MLFPPCFSILCMFATSCFTPSSLARWIACSWLLALSANAPPMMPMTSALTLPAKARTSSLEFDLNISPMASPLSSTPSNLIVVMPPFFPKARPKNSPSQGPMLLPWTLRTFSVAFSSSASASARRPSTPMPFFTMSSLARVLFDCRRDPAMAIVASACRLLLLSSSVERELFTRSASAKARPPRDPSSLLPIRSVFRHGFPFTASAISAPASDPMPFFAMPRCSSVRFDRKAFANALPPLSPSSFSGIHRCWSVTFVSKAIAIDSPPSGPSLLPSMWRARRCALQRRAFPKASPPRRPRSLNSVFSALRRMFLESASATAAPPTSPMPFQPMRRLWRVSLPSNASAICSPPADPRPLPSIRRLLSVRFCSSIFCIAFDAPPRLFLDRTASLIVLFDSNARARIFPAPASSPASLMKRLFLSGLSANARAVSRTSRSMLAASVFACLRMASRLSFSSSGDSGRRNVSSAPPSLMSSRGSWATSVSAFTL
mmetsp:Transcript_51434/g.133819  ORF Transcript_51434/g.133819 Transcript_51434/m.133819 type:complete len:489 (+) Transcript_51434:253-1719(+)